MNEHVITVDQHRNRRAIQQFVAAVLIAIISMICLAAPASANNRDVQDNADVLNKQTENYIKSVNDNQMAKIKGHPQIAVMTIKTTDGEPIEDYAQEMFDKYKFGTKGYDNGVLLLIATKDHKVRMQTGYGIESVLPDAYVDELVSDQVKADFKKNDFSAGTRTMVKHMSARIVKDQRYFRSKSDVTAYQHVGDTAMKILLYAGLAVLGIAAVIHGATFSVVSVNRHRKRQIVIAAAADITNHVVPTIANKLKPTDQQLIDQLTLEQLCRQCPPIADAFKDPDSLERFIDSDTELVNRNLLKQFIDYLLNFWVMTALAQQRMTANSINVRQLFINPHVPSQICKSISDVFYNWAGLTAGDVTYVLADYYTPSDRLAAFVTLRSAMIRMNDNDIASLAQQAAAKWQSDALHELSEADQYLALDPDTLDQIVDDAVTEKSATTYFHRYLGSAAPARNAMIDQLLDQKPQQAPEGLIKSLQTSLVDQYLATVKQTITDKLDNLLVRQHNQQIDREFTQKLHQAPIYDPTDRLQQQFIDELSVHQKESYLNEHNFDAAIAAAITTGVAILAANASENSCDCQSHWHESSASMHSGSNDDSSWFDDDDDSFWDDDSSSSSDDDDFFGGGGFDGGGFFGGDGGFSGGGGGTASW